MNQTFTKIELKKKLNYFYLVDFVIKMMETYEELEAFSVMAVEIRNDLQGKYDEMANLFRDNMEKFDAACLSSKVIVKKATSLLLKPVIEDKLKNIFSSLGSGEKLDNPFDDINTYYIHSDKLIFSLFMTRNQMILQQMSKEMAKCRVFREIAVSDVLTRISIEKDSLRQNVNWYGPLLDLINSCINLLEKDYQEKLPDIVENLTKSLQLFQEGFSALALFADSPSVEDFGVDATVRMKTLQDTIIKLHEKYDEDKSN